MPTATEADRRAFYELALRYAHAVDRRQYAIFEEITTPDAIIGVHLGDPEHEAALHEMRGHAQILKAMPSIEQYSKTMHFVENQLVEVDSDDAKRASGETYCHAHHLHEVEGTTWDYTMYIRYQDRFDRSDGDWRFCERRLWVEFTSDRPLEAPKS